MVTASPHRLQSATRPRPHSTQLWGVLAGVEAIAASVAVVEDLFIPSVVLAAMAVLSLVVRRQGFSSLGLRRPDDPRLAVKMFAFAVAWSLLQLSITMPVANHVSGERQDLSGFEDLEGNLGLLAIYLVLGWTLAAVVEEIAFRGYLFTRIREALGGGRHALVAAVVASSLLFASVHSEQGLIGVTVVTLDALAWTALRLHYRTLWASVLAHGFNNTLGFVAFFLVGPIYGFW